MIIDRIAKIVFGIISYLLVTIILLIVGFLILSGLDDINLEFLTSFPRNSMTEGGIWPSILGTVYFLSIALLFSVPVGILAAVYLSEYSKENRLQRLVLTANNILAGIPSVVFGMFGLSLFSITFGFGTSLIAGGLTLGIMSLPYIISNTHESLVAVPKSYREASMALGANKAETTFKIVIPASSSRILTGVIIAIGRIIGETAPLLFTGAAFYITRNPSSPFEPAMALPTHIFVLSAIYPDNVTPKLEGSVSVLLIIVVALFMSVAIRRRRESRKMEG
ncbi:phosphate ABC transporter permease [Mesotoga sp. Brook.08.YT.4.2.5.1]|uniref:phosphate ABC transporter permease PstA n=1 Tax=unclassified Mesotoga TaxID=1184398 RepID=UPI000C198F4C|nr:MULTISPECIES: phosphate ABC transporter permease PstA [unclassified Mesotoga]RAM59935.1 phosphate ABC transporter permease [Mesotoga sp. SC_4PWA21]PNE23524.1 phosphate ABC transporter permease [Mesotoga sp. Brook.08.YT.4.2.5.1]PVD16815.1 phosphate ABC transporter permease [Mesotoga sp. Brook.08.105.5.1]RAO97119.1 phosphate ABC transporter permease [Mesotoga sp. Brook.08.YT.4.2.5.4.]RDI91922.1 phosphate ABC transporter permease [Mesotoga sp. Brook.08.YT.4.2.5.2.]